MQNIRPIDWSKVAHAGPPSDNCGCVACATSRAASMPTLTQQFGVEAASRGRVLASGARPTDGPTCGCQETAAHVGSGTEAARGIDNSAKGTSVVTALRTPAGAEAITPWGGYRQVASAPGVAPPPAAGCDSDVPTCWLQEPFGNNGKCSEEGLYVATPPPYTGGLGEAVGTDVDRVVADALGLVNQYLPALEAVYDAGATIGFVSDAARVMLRLVIDSVTSLIRYGQDGEGHTISWDFLRLNQLDALAALVPGWPEPVVSATFGSASSGARSRVGALRTMRASADEKYRYITLSPIPGSGCDPLFTLQALYDSISDDDYNLIAANGYSFDKALVEPAYSRAYAIAYTATLLMHEFVHIAFDSLTIDDHGWFSTSLSAASRNPTLAALIADALHDSTGGKINYNATGEQFAYKITNYWIWLCFGTGGPPNLAGVEDAIAYEYLARDGMGAETSETWRCWVTYNCNPDLRFASMSALKDNPGRALQLWHDAMTSPFPPFLANSRGSGYPGDATPSLHSVQNIDASVWVGTATVPFGC